MRDINRAYRDAMAAEYAALVSAGRLDEAEHVAEELKSQYDVDVQPTRAKEPEQSKPAVAAERADAEPPPENTAEPAPVKRLPGRPRKTATSKPESGEK